MEFLKIPTLHANNNFFFYQIFSLTCSLIQSLSNVFSILQPPVMSPSDLQPPTTKDPRDQEPRSNSLPQRSALDLTLDHHASLGMHTAGSHSPHLGSNSPLLGSHSPHLGSDSPQPGASTPQRKKSSTLLEIERNRSIFIEQQGQAAGSKVICQGHGLIPVP